MGVTDRKKRLNSTEAEESSKKQKVVASLADLESENEDDSELESSDEEEEGKESMEMQSTDDEEDGDEEDGVARFSNGDPKTANKATRKALSLQEVQIAKETHELFKSNIFKLQIDELLKEVQLKETHNKTIEKVLHRLNDIIQAIPESESGLTLSEAIASLGSYNNGKKTGTIAIPFPDPKPNDDIKYTFSYMKPEETHLVGSFGFKTAIKQPEGVTIDIALIMPKTLFQDKDYLNYRYFHKRAFYLASLADGINKGAKKTSLPIKISYEYLNGDPLRPALLIEAEKNTSKKENELNFAKTNFKIRILPGIHKDTFDVRKLSPEKNCVRIQDQQLSQLPATLSYNSSILSDATYNYYLAFLHKSARLCEGFREAAKLGRLWLRQRGFNSSVNSGGFGHFEFSMVMAVLLKGGASNGNRILMNGFSSYQLFKATIKYLSENDLKSNHVYFAASTSTKLQPATFSGIALYDKDIHLNILSKMSDWSYNALKHEASITLELLGDMAIDRFEILFLKKIAIPCLHFDSVIRVPFTLPSKDQNYNALAKVQYPSYKEFFVQRMHRVLSRGLGERAEQIILRTESSTSWSVIKRRVNEVNDSEVNGDVLTIGLILNPTECEKAVTHGPSSEFTDEAEKFRQFWGKVAELRRFHDGSIKESVVWSPKQGKLVAHSIVEYLIGRHFAYLESESIEFPGEGAIEYLPSPNDKAIKETTVTSTLLYQQKLSSFEKVARIMQELYDLPLRIKTVLPTTASMRYTSVDLPIPYKLSLESFFDNAVIEFETSGRWPDDLFATEQTKTAFLLKICEEFEKAIKNNKDAEKYKISIGISSDFVPNVKSIGFLQILTPEGFGFRFRVFNDRDSVLYKRLAIGEDNNNKQTKKKRQGEASYKVFNQKYIGSITHTRTIQSLARRFPFYSPTVRLVKKWFDNHKLSQHISEETIELICLKPFVDSAPYSIPSSVNSAFNRVLHFLSIWDWRISPLILDLERPVDPNSQTKSGTSAFSNLVQGTQMSTKAFAKLSSSFEKHRQNDPVFTHAPLFIGTRHDSTGVLWTQSIYPSPLSKVFTSRMTALARAAYSTISISNDWETIFTPSNSDYDFLIHLNNPNQITKSKSSTSNGYKNLSIIQANSFPKNEKEFATKITNFIGEFYSDLNQTYGDSILFFTNGLNNSEESEVIIAGLWNPEILGSRSFKVNMHYSSKPVEASKSKKNATSEVALNKDAILEEIKRLGGDLVKDIEINKA
ncbi:Nrap protein [Nadsonia fulvescens var. elongata DSM 6958]|uniref:U3 small nucleolar RNA-associated protein 22 n=1 Tax=Nadsonia fulvescens var. elongata DSM 6958 TaxID=857566 RepID=A0A1E3PJ96_9ASCO|nr:Nrap protein [Nadsonia fulvescens var. elongata DSM 6958]